MKVIEKYDFCIRFNMQTDIIHSKNMIHEHDYPLVSLLLL